MAAFAEDAAAAPWVADRGDGTYRNPILFADYSDPDVVRVGGDYYLVSSSFNHAPALPILHSRDLVNWRLINHARPANVPHEHFATPRHGEGVWAPAIRHRDGKFWIYYPDPDFGLYVITATDPAGAWSEPVLVKGGRGLIDPCPFWDDDGQLYLIHGWARSRAGFANLLTLLKLDASGTKPLDDGTVIIDANTMPGWRTLEGPKLQKRGGYYYVFAPAGGVTEGYQAVFRAKDLYGPYEHRIVLDQGDTPINGPHQGAWVDTPSGEDWFIHFQDRGVYGRVVHLQPMTWRDDGWPVMGRDPDGDGKGEPVPVHRKPDLPSQPLAAPATSDEFAAPTLGRQWQWQANPRDDWASLAARPGHLRIRSMDTPNAGSLWLAPWLLMQKFPAPAFSVTTVLEFAPAGAGEAAGLIVFGYDYAWIGLRRTESAVRLVQVTCTEAHREGQEAERAGIDVAVPRVFLRVTVEEGGKCHFGYSLDGDTFVPLGEPFQAKPSRWVGAKVGLFAAATAGAAARGHADFDWFLVAPPGR